MSEGATRAHPRNHFRYGAGHRFAPPANRTKSAYKAFVDGQACGRKVPYQTKGQAKQALRRAKAMHGTVLHPYRCRVCGLWHLTKRDD